MELRCGCGVAAAWLRPKPGYHPSPISLAQRTRIEPGAGTKTHQYSTASIAMVSAETAEILALLERRLDLDTIRVVRSIQD